VFVVEDSVAHVAGGGEAGVADVVDGVPVAVKPVSST
jgi:hypothetical protein